MFDLIIDCLEIGLIFIFVGIDIIRFWFIVYREYKICLLELCSFFFVSVLCRFMVMCGFIN